MQGTREQRNGDSEEPILQTLMQSGSKFYRIQSKRPDAVKDISGEGEAAKSAEPKDDEEKPQT